MKSGAPDGGIIIWEAHARGFLVCLSGCAEDRLAVSSPEVSVISSKLHQEEQRGSVGGLVPLWVEKGKGGGD